MFSPKNLILLLALLWASFALKAQSCFIQEDDATGSLAFSTEQLAELEAAACSLRAVFPTEFQSDFAVYDFGFYLHQQGYEGGMPQVFQDKIAEVEQESPYFLLFGRELSNNSGLGRIWVEVRLPEGSGYPCLEDAYSSGLIYNQVSASIEIEGGYSSVGVSNMLLSGIETLNTLVDKSVNCCNVSEGNRSPLCTFCWFEEDQYGDILDDYGFVEYTGVNLTINTLATPYEGNVNSDYEITIQTSTGHEVNLISETKSFVETTTGQVDVHRYTVDNCELLDDFLRTEATSIGQLGLVYEERIIILEFEGTLRVFYKFSVDSGYSSGPGTLRPGIGDNNRAVIIPVIAQWLLKKAALAGSGVLMHIGITICFEKWFGGYETWGEAWDNTSFTGWELFYAAWSGAFAESMMIDFFGEVGNGMVEYVLNTPSASFSWGGFFSNGVTAGIITGVTNLLTSNLLGNLITKGKQIFLKYNPNVNFTPNGPNGGGGNSWYKVLKELVQLAPTFLSNPRTVKAWKGLVNRPEWIRLNTDLLEKLSGKSDDFIAKVDDFYKGSSHKLPGGWKNDPNLRLPKDYQGIEFNKYGFPNFKGNQVAVPKSKVEIDMKGNHNSGPSGDYGKARKALEDELKLTDPNATVSPGSPFEITYNGTTSDPMTWHHMEDGKTMQAVKKAVHDKVIGKHTGGVSFTKPNSLYPELKEFFDGQ
jgi:hypothetical protein